MRSQSIFGLGLRFLVACRSGVAVLAFGLVAALATVAWAQGDVVVSQSVANRSGLTRSWVSHAQMDRSRDKVTSITLDVMEQPDETGLRRDILFVQTSKGLLQALDAETGRSLWVQQVGNRDFLSLPPVATDNFVVVMNGLDMFALNRLNGHMLWEKELTRIPSQQPVADLNYIHVPHFTGHVTSYDVPRAVSGVTTEDEPKEKPKYKEERVYRSFGSINIPPLLTKQSMCWATSRGFLFIGATDMSKVPYRFETDKAVSAPLAYWTPYILVGSRDGFIYAVDETSARTRWSFSTGHAIGNQPVVIDGKVYVIPDIGGMHCLDMEHGEEQWYLPRVQKFVAASKDRLYVMDKLSRLMILDAKSGGQLGYLNVDPVSMKYLNHKTDRIYLASPSGVIQCLHELGADKPFLHKTPDPAPPTTNVKKPRPPKEDSGDEEEDGAMPDDGDEGMEDDPLSDDGDTESMSDDSEDDDGDPFGK